MPSFISTGRLAALFSSALLGCAGDGPDPSNPGGTHTPEADAGNSSDEPWSDVVADDLAINSTTLFAIEGRDLFAIDRQTGAVEPLFTIPVSDQSSLSTLELLHADDDVVLIRASEGAFDPASSSSSALWKISLDQASGVLLQETQDIRYYRGADVHDGRVYTTAAFAVFSFDLDDGEHHATYDPEHGGTWVSNPVIDAEGNVWFVRGADVFKADASEAVYGSVASSLSLGALGSQEARVYRSAARDDLLVWNPGIEGVQAGHLIAIDTAAVTIDASRPLDLPTFGLEAARAGDDLWICTLDGLYVASTSTDPTLVRPGASCSVAADGAAVYVADADGIYRL